MYEFELLAFVFSFLPINCPNLLFLKVTTLARPGCVCPGLFSLPSQRLSPQPSPLDTPLLAIQLRRAHLPMTFTARCAYFAAPNGGQIVSHPNIILERCLDQNLTGPNRFNY